MEPLSSLWYSPQTTDELTKFYCIICISYMLVHITWDCISKKTPKFALENLQYKLNELYSSSTFATSSFFIVIIFDMKNPLRTSDAFIFPLIVASLTGFMISISAIVPKQDKIKQSD